MEASGEAYRRGREGMIRVRVYTRGRCQRRYLKKQAEKAVISTRPLHSRGLPGALMVNLTDSAFGPFAPDLRLQNYSYWQFAGVPVLCGYVSGVRGLRWMRNGRADGR